jgi:hypothetical protein
MENLALAFWVWVRLTGAIHMFPVMLVFCTKAIIFQDRIAEPRLKTFLAM